MIAVTFDFGQTLAELDVDFLAARLSGRGARLVAQRAQAESARAWSAYGEAKRQGLVAHDAWCTFMRTLLGRAAVEPRERLEELVEWLWQEQPAQNLWRKPIAGMFELVRELHAAQVPLGVVSNSEGKLSELCSALGLRECFTAFADSGVLGIEKPDPAIFQWTADRLGVPCSALIHVGDAWEADIVGATRVGARAIWFDPEGDRALPRGVALARTAGEVREALARFGS